MAQWGGWCLGSLGTQVLSLVQHSGLRIHCCCSCGWDLIPGLGTPYAMEQPKIFLKKRKERKGKKTLIVLLTQVFHIFKKSMPGSSHCGEAETNLTSNHEVAGLISGLTQWVKDLALP